MTDFSIDFLGCKVSQTDAEAIRVALLDAGHSEAVAAAVRVLNTCCITAEAERKSRKRARRLVAEEPEGGQLFVTGCGAALAGDDYAALGPRVTVLPGAAALAGSAIVAAADALAGLGCKGPAPGTVPRQHTRAFVKVQDGCSFGCSYCIVPTVRGDTRSRPLELVLSEVRRRVSGGQREVVLTGVNIGLYRDPRTRVSLPGLLLAVADVEGLARVRISSIEVNHVSHRLTAVMASHPKVCPHLHVPLQSGCDAVLAHMGRHYDTRRYMRAIEYARDRLPQLNLTTDVIVGYPTEDDAAFEATLAFCERIGFTKVHAFPFSPRPGTEALAGADPVPRQAKQARSLALRSAAEERARAHWLTRVGTQDELLVERAGSRSGMTLTADPLARASDAPSHGGGPGAQQGGYTRDYCPARLTTPIAAGELVQVVVEAADDRGLVCRPLGIASAQQHHDEDDDEDGHEQARDVPRCGD